MNHLIFLTSQRMTADTKKEVAIPNEFPFPYAKPYDIQLNFMKSLYKTLEEEKIGIFESPTGTVRPFDSSYP